MEYLQGFAQNRVLLTALAAWAIAQAFKLIIYALMNRKFSWERLTGSGGMPSSHAATVCALATAAAKVYGTASYEFAVAVILGAVVLYDARGVRLETGKQAVTITAIVEFLEKGMSVDLPDIPLKELIGHTPFQVFVGSILGILVGMLLA